MTENELSREVEQIVNSGVTRCDISDETKIKIIRLVMPLPRSR